MSSQINKSTNELIAEYQGAFALSSQALRDLDTISTIIHNLETRSSEAASQLIAAGKQLRKAKDELNERGIECFDSYIKES